MSREFISIVIDSLSYLTLFALALSVITLLFFAISKIRSKEVNAVENYLNFFSVNGVSFVLLVATIATLGSLFLSEIAGFTPCKLCWYQRVFMYPLVPLLFVAIVRGERKIFAYILPLALIGFGIATYHYLIQMFPAFIQCSDEIASCAARQSARFGFVTIPFMSLVAFFNIVLVSLLSFRRVK